MDLLRDLDHRIAYGVVGGTFAGLLLLLYGLLVVPFLVRFASTTAEQHTASRAGAARPGAT